MSAAGSTTAPQPGDAGGGAGTTTVAKIVLRLALLALIDVFALWFIYNLISDGALGLAIAVGVMIVLTNVVILRDELFPIRWMIVGLILMALFSIYPIIFTVAVAFTNFGTGHLLTKEQAIEQFENITYLPEGGGALPVDRLPIRGRWLRPMAAAGGRSRSAGRTRPAHRRCRSGRRRSRRTG